MITLESGSFGWDYLLVSDDGRSIPVVSDWEYPGIASTFGWEPCHRVTDGTIDCPVCGQSASDLLASAQTYLDDHVGESVADPGYFG